MPLPKPTARERKRRFINRWVQGRRSTRRPFDSTDKLAAACRADGLGARIVWISDDVYLVAPTTPAEIAAPKAAGPVRTQDSLPLWRTRKRHERRHKVSMMPFVARWGRAWSFGTHTPYLFDRARMLRLIDEYGLRERPLISETVYFNDLCLTDGVEPLAPQAWGSMVCRVMERPTVDELRQRTAGAHVRFLNHANGGFTDAMRAFLAERIEVPIDVGRRGAAGCEGAVEVARSPVTAGLATDASQPRLAVILATYKRPATFPGTLADLAAQTFLADGGRFDLYVWNNNPAIRGSLESAVAAAKQTFAVRFHHSPTNDGPFGRVRIAHQLARSPSRYSYVVTIDDDQSLPPDFLATLVEEASAGQTVASCWAFRFDGPDSYWRRTDPGPGGGCHYAGTGGAIWPVGLFRPAEVLDIPERFRFIDDLWLSYRARAAGYRIVRSRLDFIARVHDNRGLARRLRRRKDEFRRQLQLGVGIG